MDELGWPWPKHGCFVDDGMDRNFTHWSSKASRLKNPNLGIIFEIRPDAHQAEPVIRIRLNDSTRLSLVLRWTLPEVSLLGSLVIVAREDNMILHPIHGEIPFHSAVELPPSINGWVKCSRCNTSVRAQFFDGHEEYCRKHHNIPEPSHPIEMEAAIQSEVVRISREAWQFAAYVRKPYARLQAAKHEALRLTRMLPHDIRAHVENRFTGQNWAPLLAYDSFKQ